jgi:hypothetical protein
MASDWELPIVLWPISCFDRRRKNPFPVYNRWYWLDWNQLTVEQRKEIAAIIEARTKRKSPHGPKGLDETVVTETFRSLSDDVQMLKYRRLFTEIPDSDFEEFLNHSERQNRGFYTVSVPEYFEDETGSPISKHEMIQYVSGQPFPIILGDPGSILRLGPVAPVNGRDWTIEKSNTIAQFLDIVERIRASDWYRAPCSISWLSCQTEGTRLLEAKFPNDQDTMSVLAYFRQLHAGDRLLVKACDAYMAHVGDARKYWWVNEERQAFESLVDSPPVPYNTGGKSRRQIIRMFMYGAGLLHSSSNHGEDMALASFISQHGKDKAVMIFNGCLTDFFRVAATIYPVIHQDYHHWVKNEGFAPASRPAIPDLFRGFTSPPHST